MHKGLLNSDAFADNYLLMENENKPAAPQNESDRKIIDLALRTLYAVASKQSLDFRDDILLANGISLPPDELERIWTILLSTEWVIAEAGFGNAGKISLTPQGIQLMLQFGGYKQFLESTRKVKSGKPTVQRIGPQNDKDLKPLEQVNTTDAPKRHKASKNKR